MAVTALESGECGEIDSDQGLDKRRRNRMGDHLKEADAALDEWGRMYLNDSPRLWARTPLDRAIYGPHGTATGSPVPTNIPRHVEIVDSVFLGVFTPVRQRVVLTVYAWRRGSPLEHQRRYAKVTTARFKKEKSIALECVRAALLLSREPQI